MKKSIITLLIIAMLACIGLVSCKNEVQAPAEELVSVIFDNDSARALSASLEKFEPEKYYWKYAAKKADGSNLISGQTASYNEAGALWIKEGKPGFSDTQGKYKVQGFSQGLWNFTLYGYKWTDANLDEQIDPQELQLVYSGETTGHLLKAGDNDTHSVSVVVSPAQGGNGTLWVKITGEDAIYLDRAMPIEAAANVKEKLTVKAIDAAEPIIDEFVTADYKPSLAAGSYMVTVQFTNDDGGVVFASGSVVATVYSGLTTTIKGNLTEVVTYADFGAEQNPDIITTTIGTSEITRGTTDSKVTFSSTTETKVTASMPTAAAKSLIEEMEKALDAKTPSEASVTTELKLNLSVNTTAATETTITYEIGMEATLKYQKKDATGTDTTTTKSTVETLDDFVTVEIELQAGLSDVSVTHSGEDMTSGEQWAAKTSVSYPLTLENFLAYAGTETDPDPNGYYYYYEYSSNNSTVKDKAQLYIKTKTFSPFKLSYTVPEGVAAIGSKTYTTLEAAVSDAKNGDTVILLKNVSVGAQILVDKTITLDLNGNTITGTQEEIDTTIFKVGNGTATGDLTIIGTTAGSAINAKAIAVLVKDNSNLTVNGGSYSNSYYVSAGSGDGNYIFDIYGANANATIDSVTLTGFVKGIRARGSNSSVTVSKSSADVTPGPATGDYVGYGWGLFCADQEGTLTIESGTYKTTYATSRQMIDIKRDGAVVIKDGSFTTAVKEGETVNPIPALVVFNEAKTTADKGTKLTINGGSFTYGGKLGRVNTLNNHAVVSITNGTFNASSVTIDGDTQYNLEYTISGGLYYTDPSSDPSAQIAAGYIAAPQGTNPKTWIVRPLTPEDYVASVTHGEDEPVLYLSLQSAVAAASAGDTVTLLKNITTTESISLDVSKSLIIDGHYKTITRTLESSDGSYAVTVFNSAGSSVSDNVNVTLKNLNIVATYSRGIDFSGYLNVELDGGEITVANNCVISFGNGDVSGPVRGVVENITSTMTGNNTNLWNNNALCVAGGAEVCIKSGSFTGPNAVSAWASGGTITIEGGSFTTNATEAQVSSSNHYLGNSLFADTDYYASVPSQIIVAKNSTAEFVGPIHVFHDGGTLGAKIFINGGSFNNYEARRHYSTTIVFQYNDIISISGGTFDSNPNGSGTGNDLIKDGYYAKYHPATDTAAPYWTVEAIPSDAVFELINNETQEVTFLTGTEIHNYDFKHWYDPYPDAKVYIPANHTLRLLSDYTYVVGGHWEELCFAEDDITLDLNGNTLTVNPVAVDTYYLFYSSDSCDRLKIISSVSGGKINHNITWEGDPMLFPYYTTSDAPDKDTFETHNVTYEDILNPWTYTVIPEDWDKDPS